MPKLLKMNQRQELSAPSDARIAVIFAGGVLYCISFSGLMLGAIINRDWRPAFIAAASLVALAVIIIAKLEKSKP